MMTLGLFWSFAYPVQYSGTTDTRVQFFHIINIENKKNLSYHQTQSSAASLHLLQEHHLAPDHGDRNAMLCILEATIVNSLSSSPFFLSFFHCIPTLSFAWGLSCLLPLSALIQWLPFTACYPMPPSRDIHRLHPQISYFYWQETCTMFIIDPSSCFP